MMRRNREIIYLTGFLLSLPMALTSYINSSVLESYISKYYVGIIYAIASVITIICMLIMPKILTRFGNRKTVLVFSILFLLSLILIALGGKSTIVLSAFMLYFVTGNLIFASLDIFIEDFSKDAPGIGRIRGMYLTVINLAWVVSQMMSGSIIAKSSFKGIYLISALFMALVCVIFTLSLHDFKDPKYEKVPVLKTMGLFFKRKNILKIYFINFILKFFYAWMIIYTPIYIHEYIGFNWSEIGIIFSAMLLPFVILDVPLGRLSDQVGEKKMLIIGFVIMSISTLFIPLFTTKSLALWIMILFATRVGAATVEIMSENYFFKSVAEEETYVLGFFRNTTPLSYIIAPLLAVPVLLFVPSFAYIFSVLGAIMFFGLMISLRLTDVK